jgi:hypothetical protein
MAVVTDLLAELACGAEDITLMAIPSALVPEVRALLARKQSA